LIGRGLDRRAAFATLDEASALGINILDTAERYAGGESERITPDEFAEISTWFFSPTERKLTR